MRRTETFLPMNRAANRRHRRDSSKGSSRTDTSRIGIGSPIIYPSSFLFVLYNFISWTEDIIPEFPTTHDTATIRRSNHKPQQPHRDRRRSPQAQSASLSIVRNKGWYPNEVERNNNTTSENNNNKRRRPETRTAAGTGNFIYYLEYNRLHRPTKGDAIVG